jgi:hypothetical protein
MSDYKAGLSPIEYKTVQSKWLECATKRLKPVTIDHPNLGKVELTIDSLEPFFNNDACGLQESKFTKCIYATGTEMTFDMTKTGPVYTSLFRQRLGESPDRVLSAIKLDGKSIYDLLAEKGLSYRKATYDRLTVTVHKSRNALAILKDIRTILTSIELGSVTTKQLQRSTTKDPLQIIAQYNHADSFDALRKRIRKETTRYLYVSGYTHDIQEYSEFVVTDGKCYEYPVHKERSVPSNAYRDMCDLDHQLYLWWLDIENVVFKTAAGLISQANDMGVRLINPDSEWFTFDQL